MFKTCSPNCSKSMEICSGTPLAPRWSKMRVGSHLGLHFWGSWASPWRQDGARQRQDRPSSTQVSAKMGQLGPTWAQDGPLDIILDPILSIFPHLGGDSCRNGRSVKTTNAPSLLVIFGGLRPPLEGPQPRAPSSNSETWNQELGAPRDWKMKAEAWSLEA